MMLPSKELLSEVLGFTIYSCKKVAQTSIIRYKFDAIGEVRDSSINIYELQHLCKEWAIKNKYPINILYDDQWWDKLEKPFSADLYNHRKTFSADTELESVFKATSYIMEQLKQKD